MMANQLRTTAIFVFTRRGFMANILSRLRPDCPIFAFTGTFLQFVVFLFHISFIQTVQKLGAG